MEKILITGATGNVGYNTVKELLACNKDIEVIAAVRDIKKAKETLGFNDLSYRTFDFMDFKTVKKALIGIDKLFLIRPPAISKVKKYIFPVLDLAKKLEIKQIVFLSLQGVENNFVTPHYKIEKYIKKLNLAYTFLRPSFFMQNLSTTHQAEIKKDNEIFIPAGKGKTNFIDVRDIAAVARLVLTEKKHINQAYELTGSEALDYYQIAEILSDELNREINYQSPSIFSFIWRKKKEGMKLGKILVMTALYTVARFGKAANTTTDLAELLEREPRGFVEFVQDYSAVWK